MVMLLLIEEEERKNENGPHAGGQLILCGGAEAITRLKHVVRKGLSLPI